MTEPTYTIKEIMDIQFKGIDHKLDDIRNTLKEQNVQTEKRFTQLERELEDIRSTQDEQSKDITKFKTVWTIGGTIGASLIAFFANKIF